MPQITSDPMTLLVIAALAYLIGAVPFGLVVARRMHLGDLRAIGSGNATRTVPRPAGEMSAVMRTPPPFGGSVSGSLTTRR